MRGIAAVLVMAYHYRNLGNPSHTLPSQLGPCYLMVDMFFILSGFVMARTYAGSFSGGFTWRGYAGFLEARVARVYPLYFVATLVMFVLVLLLRLDYPLKPVHALLANLFLVQNLGAGLVCATCSQKLVLPGWSISTEAAAYLLFPAFAAVALFGSRNRAVLLLMAAAGCMVLLASLPYSWLDALERRGPLDISEGTTLWPLLRCLAGFGIGVVLWRAARTGYRPTQAQAGALDVVLAVALAGLWFVPGSDLARRDFVGADMASCHVGNPSHPPARKQAALPARRVVVRHLPAALAGADGNDPDFHAAARGAHAACLGRDPGIACRSDHVVCCVGTCLHRAAGAAGAAGVVPSAGTHDDCGA